MTTRHTRPQISHHPTGKRILSVLTIPFVFLLVVIVFAGCGGEKKGQKEYEEGMNYYTVQQYESAVKQFAAAANLGHAEAQNRLGLCFAEGKGVKQDDAEGVKWFRKAAEQGIAESQYILGCAYLKGAGGLPVDLEEAAKWLEKAVKQGNTDAQKVLDSIKDVVKLFGAAKKGDSEAMFKLSATFLAGNNETEAVKWLKKAAEQGNVQAQVTLGACYDDGKGVSEDAAEAVKWFRKAAEQGNASAQFLLGAAYCTGKGVSKDEAEAVKWYRKAAEQGNASAQCDLGICYYTGKGVSKDESEALKWYCKAAEQGDARAQFCLGGFYLEKEDYAEAKMWYRKSAAAGYERAAVALQSVEILEKLSD